ncbi:hypothetical protein A6P39_042840 (plasmid) [Streptomyces sp. FXJ1.172]|uniref:hypothetical protein n=1 Tax=Streptomyces sp. FXJ1.172 TaxID=710705 RepID=UPI0023DD12F8|nr:hypothetical protein [Streptomyces sp. FXJ1.172]WEP00902.1 hypothetical protein A6P39_042840 [Streptomyces sp. FXJ1.172]
MTTSSQQASSNKVYQQGIDLLEGALSDLRDVQNRVHQRAVDLQPHYQGEDGLAFQGVIEEWMQRVERIKGTCTQLMTHLSEGRNLAAQANEHNVRLVNNQKQLTATAEATFRSLQH